MRRSKQSGKIRGRIAIAAASVMLGTCVVASGQEPTPAPDPQVKQAQEVQQPAPTTGAGAEGAAVLPRAATGGGPLAGPSSGTGTDTATAGLSSTIGQGDAFSRGTTDAGDLLGRSLANTGVETQKRSPIVNEPRVRGYHLGQIVTYADGAFWFPARQDLDTFFSKIDSGVVQNVTVYKGPYTVRYGPGFSFIDITTFGSERYANGLEFHGQTSSIYKTNGQQIYGRQSLWGGAEHWGTRISYGQRTGNDYTTGLGTEMPSSYNSRDVDFVLGMDTSPDGRLEFGYMRLDQTDVEFPGQVFDTQFLITNGYRLRYVLERQTYFDLLTIDGFYNRTVVEGNAQRDGKRRQIPQLNLLGLNGFTDMDQLSTGGRLAITWGEANCPQLTIGSDLRYVDGLLNEFVGLFGLLPGDLGGFPCPLVASFPIPRSHQTTIGGLFIEYVLPFDECLTFKAGLRGDYFRTQIDQFPNACDCECDPDTINRYRINDPDFSRQLGLFMAFMSAEAKMTEHVWMTAGVAYAQRPPTQTELYALEPFLAILQQGTTAVLGDPNLSPEQLWQFDLGVRVDCERFRAGATGFYAWIHDYITYAALDNRKGTDPTFGGGISFRDFGVYSLLVQFANTDRAYLTGGEAYCEWDYNPWLTPFATLLYVRGEDQTRDHRGNVIFNEDGDPIPGLGRLGPTREPLPMIPPLEARLGVRVHGEGDNPNWAIEFTARLVDAQNRFAGSLGETNSNGFTTYDIRAFWRPHDQLLLTSGIENVFDRYYREHLDLRTGLSPFNQNGGVYQPGFNCYLGAELRY